MTSHRLIALLTLAASCALPASALAQGTFPLPEAQATCTKSFAPLREDAETKGKMIKAASERHAPPDEACKLIGNYSVAEVKMIKFVEANAAECGIQASVLVQLKAGHRNTEGLEKKVCALAEQSQKRGIPGEINDFGDPAFERRRF